MKKTLSLGLIMAMVLLLAMAAGPVFGGSGGNNLENAKKAQKGLNEKVLGKKNVVGTAIGQKDGAVVLRVFTAKSGVAGIPNKQGDFDVVVKVTGPITALGPRTGAVQGPMATHTTSKIRPVPIGVSTGHPDITAGTIGVWVTEGTKLFALSNNHVYADQNSADIGDNVLQPGDYDGGVEPGDAIGTLSDFEPIKFNNFGQCFNKGKRCNEIDAAIAEVSSGITVDYQTPSGGYGTPDTTIVSAILGQKVQKYGRTTSQTNGEITGINVTVNIGYDSGTALFVDQIIVETGTAFILGGDSGSLLVTDPDRNPVGLLFAGNSDGTFAIANRIDLVLTRFGVTVAEESASEPDATPPVITAVAAGEITADSATITWTTNEEADSKVDYGSDNAYGSEVTAATLVTTHSVSLTGLAADTEYHFKVTSVDGSTNSASSGDFTFVTEALDTTAPQITSVEYTEVTSDAATIIWATNEEADSKVDYGSDNAYGSEVTAATLVTTHSVSLTGLSAETEYHFKVTSADGSSNSSESGDLTFTTLAAPDQATEVSVASVSYATEGGKEQNKHLLITVALVDDLGDPVGGASVTIDLSRDGSFVASGIATTGTDGKVIFSLKNAASGCYTTTVTDVTAAGLTRVGATPDNEYCKTSGSGTGNKG